MPDKLLETSLSTYWWVLIIAAWGGVAGYIGKLKTGNLRFSIAELVGELVISAFVGVMAYLMCQSIGIDELLTAAIVGISGHMGSRAILIIENVIKDRVLAFLDKK